MRESDFHNVSVFIGGRVLDAGMGDGRNMSLLDGHGEVYGIELVEERAKEARGKNKFYKSIVIGDLADTSFEDDMFDTVFCKEVLEHVTNIQGVFNEAYRILKPEGYFIIISPTLWWRRGPYSWRLSKLLEYLSGRYVFRYVKEKEHSTSQDNPDDLLYLTFPPEVRHHLKKCGFTIEFTEPMRCVVVAKK
jgi:2-polyprenyl-3-methyl-5-hydroxy-6-metoxy-1,4-benzoquinol methylase